MKKHTRIFVWSGAAALTLGFVVASNSRENPTPIRPGHIASIYCGEDGEVHGEASLYNEGEYQVDSGAFVPFTGGFSVGPLDGTKKHTLTVKANDWPKFKESAGPCREATTIPEKTTTSTSSTTSSVPQVTSTSSIPNTSSTNPCQEDEECWDCETMGNKICATTTSSTEVSNTNPEPVVTVIVVPEPQQPVSTVQLIPAEKAPVTAPTSPRTLPPTL